MSAYAPRLLVSATASGAGKTTVACGLLRALQRRGLRVRACKCGPDYIDPLFHERVIHAPSRNLDLFLGDADLVRELVVEGSRTCDLTLMEGAMGYYDGIAQSHDASAYEVAHVTNTPVVLVVDACGRALSVAAEVLGFMRLRTPSHIAGVVLNHVSEGFYPQLKALVERECGIVVMGYVPTLDEASLPSRHLGLVSPSEVADLEQRVDALAKTLERTIDVAALVALAQGAGELACTPQPPPASPAAGLAIAGSVAAAAVGAERVAATPVATAPVATAPVAVAPVATAPVIAVAQDDAFSFYYHDSLALLERMGARLVPFSPLADKNLPDGACGLYMGGGYPELHARELSQNAGMREQIRTAIASGMPTIAECGGFLYLHRTLEDDCGRAWPMVGALDARAFRRGRLGRFGYVTLTARRDGLLASAGERLRAHEFHYWESTHPGDGFHAEKPQSSRAWDCVISTPTLYAGFPHLYLRGNPQAAARFVRACAAYADASRAAGDGLHAAAPGADASSSRRAPTPRQREAGA